MEAAAYHLLKMSAPVPDLLFPPREITRGEGRLALATPRHLPGTLAEATTWHLTGATDKPPIGPNQSVFSTAFPSPALTAAVR